MDFNITEYLNVFQKNGLEKAKSYKSTYIPRKLYKFIPLIDDKKENNLKFESLKKGQTWLSGFGSGKGKLNDLFEFKMLSVNKTRLQEFNWDEVGITFAVKVLDLFKDSHYVCCFVEEMFLPMWAYYANNHLGFCIEYEIERTDHFYKVLYEEERAKISTTISYLVKSLINDAKKLSDQPSDDTYFWSEILKLSFTVKHNSWKHEKEYRLLFPSEESGKNGILVNNAQIGVRPSKMFIGVKCIEENEYILKNISRDLGIDIFKMYVDDDAFNFYLNFKSISDAKS